ncbi:MAG: hypothetical protein K2W96_11430 [Gemmataceae bacterium]|nr:hypothetical protein [Gemmataceae bacterium]
MTDQELQELAKGAKALSELELADLRTRIPSGSLKSREGFIEGVRAARSLLNGSGDGLAPLEAVAARDLLAIRRINEEYRASGDEERDREMMERLMPDILAGKLKGIPMDEVIRRVQEQAWAGSNQEHNAG